jgi:sulfotransferase family protein
MSIEPIQEKHLKDLHELLRTFKARMAYLVGPALVEFIPQPPADYENLPPERVPGYVHDCHTVLRHVKSLYDFFMERLVDEVRAAPPPAGHPSDVKRLGYRFDVGRLTRFPDQRPVFVVGARHSGTTTMANALRAATDWFGWTEGHLFATLPVLLSTLSQTWQDLYNYEGEPKEAFALGQVDLYRMLDHIAQFANQTYTDAPGAREAGRWVDNSPGPEDLMAVPLLGHLYPQGKFLFMHCHPLRAIRTHLQRNPPDSVELAGMMWILAMRCWYKVRKSLRPENFLELSLVDLIWHTGSAMDRLTPFLGLTARQAQALNDFIIGHRPKYESPGELTELRPDDTGWPEVVRSWFQEIGASTARYWGYPLTQTTGPAPP